MCSQTAPSRNIHRDIFFTVSHSNNGYPHNSLKPQTQGRSRSKPPRPRALVQINARTEILPLQNHTQSSPDSILQKPDEPLNLISDLNQIPISSPPLEQPRPKFLQGSTSLAEQNVSDDDSPSPPSENHETFNSPPKAHALRNQDAFLKTPIKNVQGQFDLLKGTQNQSTTANRGRR